MVTAKVTDITRQDHRLLQPNVPECGRDYEHAAVMPGGQDRQVAHAITDPEPRR